MKNGPGNDHPVGDDDYAASEPTTPLRRSTSLHRRQPSLAHYQTTSISKHYAVNRQILQAFEIHYEAKAFRSAYAFGLQFCQTALLEIPKHGYYNSDRHESERMESALQAVQVANMLVEIQRLVQEEDESKSAAFTMRDMDRVDKLRSLALEQVERASKDQFESRRQKTERDLTASYDNEWIVCEPLLACSDSWSSILCPGSPPAATASVTTGRTRRDNDVEERLIHTPQSSSSARYPSVSDVRSTISQNESLSSATSATVASRKRRDGSVSAATIPSEQRVPPEPIPSSSTSSSKSKQQFSDDFIRMPLATAIPIEKSSSRVSRRSASISSTMTAAQPPGRRLDEESPVQVTVSPGKVLSGKATEDLLLEKALYLSGLEVTTAEPPPPPLASQATPPVAVSASSSRASTSTLALATLKSLYHDDVEDLRKSGRIRMSLVHTYQGRVPESTNGCTVIAPLLCIHHLLESTCPDPGLHDAVVAQVIDQETPVILSSLRKSLGLNPQAFLIPSDAHDYLIDHGQLAQSQFVNVVGGNILDEKHLDALVDALMVPDLADRQLAATLFFHQHVVAILKLHRKKGVCWFDLVDGLPLKDTLRRPDESDFDLAQRLGLPPNGSFEAFVPRTARIRCLDAEALKALLRWYACSKFGEENIDYIDNYEWNDAQSDFDPRVFQAFIWGDAL